MQQCTCKKEIVGWYFNFDPNNSKFERCDGLGDALLKSLRRAHAVTYSSSSIATALYKIEFHPELRQWFLRKVKKYSNKTCYGWQCKMKIIKPNKACKIHFNKKDIQK